MSNDWERVDIIYALKQKRNKFGSSFLENQV
ncbi:hypothetical protein AAUPMG_12306 [Pasteurella multocida subsp. multocida str. Anand1_goat]|nr:hypothetical protein AAUPMG_12306 [Pasteurella multocida subsp. multocida str. Anand1_goat]